MITSGNGDPHFFHKNDVLVHYGPTKLIFLNCTEATAPTSTIHLSLYTYSVSPKKVATRNGKNDKYS